MRNMLYLAFLGAVFFVVVGWFMDWYSISSVRNSNGKSQWQFEVDTNKVSADLTRSKEKLTKTIEQLKNDTGYQTNFEW